MDARLDSKSITNRFLAVIALIVGLMIPLLMVTWVVSDRENYYHEALGEIAQAWAPEQLIAGPILTIPYSAASPDDAEVQSSLVLIMPRLLNAEVQGTHEYRRRGIFDAPVLRAEVELTGRFAPVDLEELGARFGALKPKQASVLLGVSDARGLRTANMDWNGQALIVSSTNGIKATPEAIQAAIEPVDYEPGGTFKVSLSLRFTDRLGIMVAGDDSSVSIASDWPHPSFDGRFLPDAHGVTDEGFQASWTSNALARGYPSVASASDWEIDSPYDAESHSVGFSVFEPVTLYTAVSRALKYGVMFIVLTLVSALCIELVTRNRLHIVQYGVVGLGLVLFYLLLLSLAEHIGFGWAYLIATLVLGGMIAGYVRLVTRHWAATAIISAVLALLYSSLYTILQLDAYSLLLGTALLLILLGGLMAATRNLNREGEPFRQSA